MQNFKYKQTLIIDHNPKELIIGVLEPVEIDSGKTSFYRIQCKRHRILRQMDSVRIVFTYCVAISINQFIIY